MEVLSLGNGVLWDNNKNIFNAAVSQMSSVHSVCVLSGVLRFKALAFLSSFYIFKFWYNFRQKKGRMDTSCVNSIQTQALCQDSVPLSVSLSSGSHLVLIKGALGQTLKSFIHHSF